MTCRRGPCGCGAPGCDGCQNAADDFGRANAADIAGSSGSIGGPWLTALSGTIALVGGKASSATPGSIYNYDPSAALRPGFQQVDVSANVDGDEVGLLIAGGATANAILLVAFGASAEVRLYQNTAGGTTLTGATLPPGNVLVARKSVTANTGETHTLTAWIPPGQSATNEMLILFDNTPVLGLSAQISLSGAITYGIANGASNTGTVTWDNYSASIMSTATGGVAGESGHDSCCSCCICCPPSQDGFSQFEVIAGGGTPIDGSYFPQRPTTAIEGGSPDVDVNPRAWDTCGNDPNLGAITLAGLAGVTILGGTMSGPGTTGAGTILLNHDTALIDPDLGYVLLCQWQIIWFYANGSANGFALQYNSDGVAGLANCTDTANTLTLVGSASDYLIQYGFLPPTTITIEGIP